MYYTYILRCEDNSLYSGIATDLSRRFHEHAQEKTGGAKYTASHPPMYFEAAWVSDDRSSASKLESKLKQLTKPQKEALIRDNRLDGLSLSSYGRIVLNEQKNGSKDDSEDKKLLPFLHMLSYAHDLDENNNRTWFHEQHARYDIARADFLDLLEMVRFSIMEEAPDLADELSFLNAKGWVYRTARDMRFYTGKPPYHPNFRAYISSDRKSWLPIGYFLKIGDGSSVFGTGLWCRDNNQINAVRNYLNEHADEFLDAFAQFGEPLVGNTLKKTPQGFDASSPVIDWIKYKDWSMLKFIPNEILTTYDAFDSYLRPIIRSMEPLRQFFLKAARSELSKKEELEMFFNRG